MIEIYHGEGIEIKKPKLILDSKFNKDFGDGFFCTDKALDCLKFEGSEFYEK